MSHEQEPVYDQPSKPEISAELGRERRSELESHREDEAERLSRSHENQQERAAEARQQAEANAVETDDAALSQRIQPGRLEQRGPISRKQRDMSFNHNMNEIRQHMSLSSRTFSRIIHTKAVEKSSEFIGSTFARPNSILSGALFAFIIGLVVYLLARRLGYPLSGFESIISFVIGWILGLLYDYVRSMVAGKKTS